MSCEKIRFLDNNLLGQEYVILSGTDDYEGNSPADVLDPYNFGIYRLTQHPTLGGYCFDVELSASLEPSSFAMIPSDVRNFYLTSETEVVIQASNFGFESVEKEFKGKFSQYGVFCNIRQAETDNAYRYWRIWIKEFSRAPDDINESLDIKYLYFGDHVEINDTNISNGIGVRWIDNSTIAKSQSGRRYPNYKKPTLELNNCRFGLLKGNDRRNFQRFYQRVGKTENFLVVPDPSDFISVDPYELMRVMHFSQVPSQSHVVFDMYDQSFTLVEAV